MSGLALHAELQIEGALAIEPQGNTSNIIGQSGRAIAVSEVVNFDLYRPQVSRLNVK